MNGLLLVLLLDEQRFAVPVFSVERLVMAVEVTRLPVEPTNQAEGLLGVINVHGSIVPVVNLRPRFHLPERKMRLSDHIAIVNTGKRLVGLWVDGPGEIISGTDHQVVSLQRLLATQAGDDAAAIKDKAIVFIPDLESFLSLEQEALLERFLQMGASK
jgi:purine-binding chemotaxis protein CheW